MEEKEFSFKNYFIYILRKWIFPVVAVLIGAGVGIYYSLSFKTTNIGIYEGSIKFSVSDYVKYLGTGDGMSEGEYLLHTSLGESLMLTASNPLLKTATYEYAKTNEEGEATEPKIKDIVYPKIKNEQDKRNEFFKSLNVTKSGYVVRVSFAYDTNYENGEEIAIKVVETYTALAKAAIIQENSVMGAEGNNAVTTQRATRNFDTAGNALVADNERPSLVLSLAVGVIGGLFVGIVIVTLIYAFDKRVKSISDVLPEGEDNVVSAEKELIKDSSFDALRTLVLAGDDNSVLLSGAAADGGVTEYAKAFCEYLNKVGTKAELTVLTAVGGDGTEDWHTFFDSNKKTEGCAIYVYDNVEPYALGYIAAKVKSTCLIINQKDTKINQLQTAASEVAEAGGKYLGTVLYNITDSYIG